MPMSWNCSRTRDWRLMRCSASTHSSSVARPEPERRSSVRADQGVLRGARGGQRRTEDMIPERSRDAEVARLAAIMMLGMTARGQQQAGSDRAGSAVMNRMMHDPVPEESGHLPYRQTARHVERAQPPGGQKHCAENDAQAQPGGGADEGQRGLMVGVVHGRE